MKNEKRLRNTILVLNKIYQRQSYSNPLKGAFLLAVVTLNTLLKKSFSLLMAGEDISLANLCMSYVNLIKTNLATEEPF